VAYPSGSTRVGNPAFATFTESKFPTGSFYRITHASDGVPRVPHVDKGYRHAGTELWLFAKDTQDASQVQMCNGAEDTSCIQQYGPAGIEPINSVREHLTRYSFMSGTFADCLVPPALYRQLSGTQMCSRQSFKHNY
jgi:Lipase (class 3)